MEISFHGATQTVTGSKHLIRLESGFRILLDCGMFQGMGPETHDLNRHFGFSPHEVDLMVLSHAHIDHSGLIPRLVKQGFKGRILCTQATRELLKFMLLDSARIIEADVRFVNKRRTQSGRAQIDPLYTEEDALIALPYLEPITLDTPFKVNDEVTVQLIPNGHILGSACVFLMLKDGDRTVRFAFTGDVGRYGAQLMPNPMSFPQADVIVCESTYGDRMHPTFADSGQQLLDAITHTCVSKRGRVVIPAFSLGRTQEILFSLSKLEQYGLLPQVPVYVDSPLALHATQATRNNLALLNDEVHEFMKKRPDPFSFAGLRHITSKEDSQRLNANDDPCVIISASGMAEAGRVKHHLMHALPHAENTVVIVGYAGPSSLAGRLRAGAKEVSVFGEPIRVRAEVRVIESYSAHGDRNDLMRYLSCQNANEVSHLFLVHGEPDGMIEFEKHLHGRGFSQITRPQQHDVFMV